MPIAEQTDRYGRQYMDIRSILYQQKRMIFLTEPVTDALASDVVQQLLHLAATGSEDITLVINSPGGSVTAGLAIYDAMKGISCDVSTLCIGSAASMGAFLLSAGTPGKRYAAPHSEIMIHQVMGGAHGQAVDVQIAAQRIARMKQELDALLAAHTGQSLERISRDTDRDHFLTAREAVEYGIVDAVKDTFF